MFRLLVASAVAVALLAACAGDPRIMRKRPLESREVYIVKDGDTLEGIGARYGVSAADIRRANGLKLGTVEKGQRLFIPQKSASISPKVYKRAERPKKGKRGGEKFIPPSKAPSINISLEWPVRKPVITSKFGIRRSGKHDGIDIDAPEGAEILSAADGEVIFSGWGPTGYGNIVVIKHSSEVFTVYAHNKSNAVKKGNRVKRGQKIAYVGKSGRASAAHLHFEVRVNRVAYDPLAYLPRR